MNFLGTDPAKGLKNKGFLGSVLNRAGKEARDGYSVPTLLH